jgi:beta-galactosidase
MLEVAPDAVRLDAAARDEVRVMVRALDQAGNVLPFLMESVRITVEGPARLIGPERSPLLGGTTGFWLRATGAAGVVRVTVEADRFAPVAVEIQAE